MMKRHTKFIHCIFPWVQWLINEWIFNIVVKNRNRNTSVTTFYPYWPVVRSKSNRGVSIAFVRLPHMYVVLKENQ